MNMWGLTPDFLDVLENGFKEFFEKEVQNLRTLNRKCASTLQSLRYFVPTISERRVFSKYCIKRENQCRSRAAAEIQSDEAVEG